MKALKKSIFLFTILFSTASFAQNYNTGIGVRLGPSNGLTVKHFIGSNTAIEGLLVTRWGGFHVAGLYEKHQWVFDDPNLSFYYGGGAHIGFWDSGRRDGPAWFFDDDDFDDDYVVIGVDGIVGIEYTFEKVPFNISLDYKPAFNIVENTGFWLDELGLSIRFAF